MFDIREKPNLVEKALLIGVYFRREDAEETADLMSELKELVETLSIGVAETVCVFVRQVTARHLTGKGKAAELMAYAKELGCDCIIFDNQLSPAQQRAWEEESGLCVIDRQEVILDIFNLRARTREARLQVAMARMEYSMPRLTRMWAHLDRQRGAGGTGGGGDGAARGMGESQLEVDRRLAEKRLDKLKADLNEVKKQRDTQRKERSKVPMPHGAIVGYTNAGKSSLLNTLTKSDVLAENKLFATLDTSTRRMELPDGQQVLLTDTVGFVRKLPHDLVQSFRATLEEAALADFLIHVVDASAASAEKFIKTTTEVLEEIGAGGKKTILVFNKIDLITAPERRQELQHRHPDAVMMSLKTGEGIEDLLHRIHEMVFDRVVRLDLRLPMNRLDLLALAHEEGKVLHEEYDEDVAVVQCVVPKRLASRFEKFATGKSAVRES
jgi:GTP-binding protein HflX